MSDPYNLQRFVDAQAGVYGQICAELRRGSKTSHWIWFIFPQLQGLGHSAMATRYAIHSLAEAEAYRQHPVLGQRLNECCDLLLQIQEESIEAIMGYPDDLKLRSSMTLFSQATGNMEPFQAVLEKYFNSQPDAATLKLLAGSSRAT